MWRKPKSAWRGALLREVPKACMGGWGRRLMLINPSGKVLPCHAAEVLPGLSFENMRNQTLVWIWRESSSFRRFRGEDWMLEPCRSCDRRGEDFGGCRCPRIIPECGDATPFTAIPNFRRTTGTSQFPMAV